VGYTVIMYFVTRDPRAAWLTTNDPTL